MYKQSVCFTWSMGIVFSFFNHAMRRLCQPLAGSSLDYCHSLTQEVMTCVVYLRNILVLYLTNRLFFPHKAELSAQAIIYSFGYFK